MKAEVPTLCQLCSAQIGLHRDSGERKKGQRPLLSGCWGSPVPAAVLAHACKQPFHGASSCLSLLALGRRGAKNNQAGTSTGGTFTVVASGQACLLPAGLWFLCPAQSFCGRPLPSFPRVLALSLLLFLE